MVTIADVAKSAGVSISTVSYVLSGKRAISPETQERVRAAIDRLNYRPHAGARSLAGRVTNVIGLQAPLRAGVDLHVVTQIVAGVAAHARTFSYDVLLLTSDDGEALERAARGSMVDALLVMDVEAADPRVATLAELGLPSALIGVSEGGIPCVDFDFEAAGRLAAQRLADLGHRRIALLGAPAEVLARHTSYADRLARGFLAACADRGISGSVHACPSSVAAVATLDEALAADPTITGLLIHNEGALPHLIPHVLARPERLGVVALCPQSVANAVPGLTDVISVPAEGIGTAAAELIREMLAGKTPAAQVLLPAALWHPHSAEVTS